MLSREIFYIPEDPFLYFIKMDFMDTNSLGARVKQLQMVKWQSKICSSIYIVLWKLLQKE